MMLSRSFDYKIGNIFEKYGQFIARRPWYVIVLVLTGNCLLGLHVIRLRFISDMEALYAPTNSDADRERSTVKSFFQEQSRTHFYPEKSEDLDLYGTLIVFPQKESNILNTSYKKEIEILHNYILNITVEYGGLAFNYSDLCAMREDECAIDGYELLTAFFWEQQLNGNVTYPCFAFPLKGNVCFHEILGDVSEKNKKLASANILKLKYNLRKDREFKKVSEEWERKFVTEMKSFGNPLIRAVYAHSDSLITEINDNTINDIQYFSLTFTMMISYTSFVTAGGNCVSQRGWLGRAGVIASALSILTSFGLSTLLNVDFINVVGVMPFLILGIGVNDMFILLSGLADAPVNADVEKRIGITLRTTGLAVTITSLTDIIAFASGITSTFMVVRNFCIYSVFAVIFCYMNIMTFFVACMAIHERRVAANRHCLTCQPLKTREEMKKLGYGCCMTCFCSGSTPESRLEQESLFEKVPRIIIPKIVLYKPMKVAILFSFLVLVGFSIWGTINLKQGFLGPELVSEDSYFMDFLKVDQRYFPTTFYISVVFKGRIPYSSSTSFHQITNLENDLISDPFIDKTQRLNWYTAFYNFSNFNQLSEENYTESLKNSFLPANPRFKNDIIFNSDDEIIASRIYLKTTDIKNTYHQGRLMQNLRKKLKKATLDVFVYSPNFIYFEQYTAVLPEMIKTVSTSVVAVFLITCLFMSHPLVILFVTGSMVMILIGLFGFFYYWNITLTTVTMILILIGVGFSVDFSAHICHAFMSVDGPNRNVRVNDAIVRAGGPIFNGAVATIIGILLLLFTKSHVFTSFFKIMILIVAFGLGHSLLLLPVVLSIVGPRNEHPRIIERISKEGQDNLGFVDAYSGSPVIYNVKL